MADAVAVGHVFERAMPYAWGGYRMVCSCGESGLVVDTEGAARVDHERHARTREALAAIVLSGVEHV